MGHRSRFRDASIRVAWLDTCLPVFSIPPSVFVVIRMVDMGNYQIGVAKEFALLTVMVMSAGPG